MLLLWHVSIQWSSELWALLKKMLFLILVIDSMIINNGYTSEFVPEDIINDAVNIASGNSVVPSDSKLLLDPK